MIQVTSETEIKAAIKGRLQEEGFCEVTVRPQAERGADVDAVSPDREWRLIGEVKGEPSETILQGDRKGQIESGAVRSNQYRHWLAGALWELIGRMNAPSRTVYAIFLPDSRRYRTLIEGVPLSPIQALKIECVLVNDDGFARFDSRRGQFSELPALRHLGGKAQKHIGRVSA